LIQLCSDCIRGPSCSSSESAESSIRRRYLETLYLSDVHQATIDLQALIHSVDPCVHIRILLRPTAIRSLLLRNTASSRSAHRTAASVSTGNRKTPSKNASPTSISSYLIEVNRGHWNRYDGRRCTLVRCHSGRGRHIESGCTATNGMSKGSRRRRCYECQTPWRGA